MNCFMGYNPLVAKEVKITTWIKEFDGDSPVYPSFPNDGDCFVVFATDEDALTHNALSKKTYTNGEWTDAEGGGGGATFPTFTLSGGSWSCDMTYAEAKANYEANVLGNEVDGSSSVCYTINEDKTKYWSNLYLDTGESLEFFDIPEGITEGLSFGEQCIFASDGNFYGIKE